jgi:hypothetical protein
MGSSASTPASSNSNPIPQFQSQIQTNQSTPSKEHPTARIASTRPAPAILESNSRSSSQASSLSQLQGNLLYPTLRFGAISGMY